MLGAKLASELDARTPTRAAFGGCAWTAAALSSAASPPKKSPRRIRPLAFIAPVSYRVRQPGPPGRPRGLVPDPEEIECSQLNYAWAKAPVVEALVQSCAAYGSVPPDDGAGRHDDGRRSVRVSSDNRSEVAQVPAWFGAALRGGRRTFRCALVAVICHSRRAPVSKTSGGRHG